MLQGLFAGMRVGYRGVAVVRVVPGTNTSGDPRPGERTLLESGDNQEEKTCVEITVTRIEH